MAERELLQAIYQRITRMLAEPGSHTAELIGIASMIEEHIEPDPSPGGGK